MNPKYTEFVRDIDLDALYEAIGFEPTSHARGYDSGKCPDVWGLHKHGDTTGKFGIHRDKRIYYCFVCGGGSLLSLIMEIYSYDIDEATDWLYRLASPSFVSDDDFLAEIEDLLFTESVREAHTLPPFNPKVIEPWMTDHSWFEERQISVDLVVSHKLGFDPHHRKRSPKPDEDDYYGPAIILPHFWGGKLVGWQERWLEEERPKWCAKYTNTSSFPKRFTLFNWDNVFDRKHPIVILESVPSVLRLETLGVPAVATFGSTVTQEQMKLLRRFQQGVIIANDNDPAGEKMRNSLIGYLESFIPVRLIDNKAEGVPYEANVADLESDEVVLDVVRKAPLVDVFAASTNT